MKKRSRAASASAVVATLVAGLLGASASIAHAQPTHYYILIGGTCDSDASVYNTAWLRGGIRRIVDYPAGGVGACNNGNHRNNMPMDQSVAQGYDAAKRVVQAAYHENPRALFTIVGYSQGAIVGNMALNDIADGKLGVNKSQFTAKFYGDPMQPGTGLSSRFPRSAGAPSPYSGYVSFGEGRAQFNGIRFTRYCIHTDGICDASSAEAPGGYFAQHWCYQRTRPADRRSIMGDTIADDENNINNTSWIAKQDCHGWQPGGPFMW